MRPPQNGSLLERCACQGSDEPLHGFRRSTRRRFSNLTQPLNGFSTRTPPALQAVGAAAGAFGSLVGVGGGVLIVPAIVNACP